MHQNNSTGFSSPALLFNLISGGERSESTIHTLLQEGVDIDAKDPHGHTPLLLACELRLKNIAQLLINYGANVDYDDGAGKCTALHYASRNGDDWINIIQSIGKRVSDLDVRSKFGLTAMHIAALSGSTEIVKFLVEAGADIHAVDNKGMTPLEFAASVGQSEVVEVLLDAAERKRCFWYHKNQQALLRAAELGWLEVVKSLIKRKHNDFSISRLFGVTALQLASKFGHLEIVKYLVEENVLNINARSITIVSSNHGKTALLFACQMQKLDVVEYLLQANASCDIADSNGYSPLYYLIKTEWPNLKLIKLCIEKTAYLMSADYNALFNNYLLKVNILQDVEFCCQVIVNKYNHDLLKLYKLPLAESLPSIEAMKIVSRTNVFQAIKSDVSFEIQSKGHCNLFNVQPKVLRALCVKSLLEPYDKKLWLLC